MDSFDILGCPCQAIKDDAEATRLLAKLIDAGNGGYSVAINAEKIYHSWHNQSLAAAIRGASLWVPDGSGAVLGMKMLHRRKAGRIDLPRAALVLANHKRYRLTIIGATAENNRLAADGIRANYPDIELASSLDGYQDDDTMVEFIKDSGADLALLGLGSPKQELFAASHEVKNTFIVCCGGAINILAGKLDKAPAIFADNHLEWFYRLAKEPSRFKRQKVLPVFLARLAWTAMRRKRHEHG